MALFQHEAPELAEAPLPPALPGEIVPVTKLHALRRRQLQDIARAYGIDLPPEAVKTEILGILVTHERAGAFRKPPTSLYHRLRAEIDHDEKLEPHVKREREQRIARAEAEEFPKTAEPKRPAAKAESDFAPDPDAVAARALTYELFAYDKLQKMCKDHGINCVGKSKAWIQTAIATEELKRERADAAA